ELALARYADRRGNLEGAQTWYRRSLVARSNPLLESYVQHRIGLLRYQLGDLERAAAAFQLVTTTRGAHQDLVREASWYLERLEPGAAEAGARRVVLPGLRGP